MVQVPLEQVGRIEIVKGPASSVWGSALGGVVHLLSPELRLRESPLIEAYSSYGTWGTHQQRVRLAHSAGKTAYMLAFSRGSTDGFRPKSAHDGVQAYGKVETELSSGRLGLAYGHFDGETEDFIEFGYPKRHEYTTKYGRAYYTGVVLTDAETRLQLYGVSRRDRVEYCDATSGQVLNAADFDEPNLGFSAQLTSAQNGYGRFSGGVDLEESKADFRFRGGPAEKRQHKQGLYLNWTHVVGSLSPNVSMRRDHHSVYGTAWNPGAGLAYAISSLKTTVRTNAVRGFGAPPLSAAYVPETETHAPNPNLRPERATAYNLGFESSPRPGVRLRTTFYYNDIEDAIENAQNAEGKLVQMNFARQERKGWEIETWFTPLANLEVTAGTTFNDVTSTDTQEIINGTANHTRDLTFYYHHPRQQLEAWIGGHYVEYDVAQFLIEPPNSFTVEDGKFLWNVKITQHLPSFLGVLPRVDLNVRNVFDEEFWWITPYPLPGRSFDIGVTVNHGT